MRLFKFLSGITPIIVAIVTAVIIGNPKEDFATEFEKNLRAMHPDLETERLDVSGEKAYAIFSMSLKGLDKHGGAVNIDSLASDMKKVYCDQIAKKKADLKIPHFHVSIRAPSGFLAFTHSFSVNGCV